MTRITSWRNLVEVWLSIIEIIERHAIHRGADRSVKDLNAKVSTLIDGWNAHCHPLVRTEDADDILPKVDPQAASDARHRTDPVSTRRRSFTCWRRALT